MALEKWGDRINQLVSDCFLNLLLNKFEELPWDPSITRGIGPPWDWGGSFPFYDVIFVISFWPDKGVLVTGFFREGEPFTVKIEMEVPPDIVDFLYSPIDYVLPVIRIKDGSRDTDSIFAGCIHRVPRFIVLVQRPRSLFVKWRDSDEEGHGRGEEGASGAD